MDALRTAVSAWGAGHRIDWPPTVEQARHSSPSRRPPSPPSRRIRAGPGAHPAQPGAGPRPASSTSSTARLRTTRLGPRAGRVLRGRRRARLQRLDLHGPRHHLDPLGHRQRRLPVPSAPSRGRCTAAPRRRSSASSTRSARRSAPRSGSTMPSTAGSGSWASATASTAPTTRAPRRCARWPSRWAPSPTGCKLAVAVEDIALRMLRERYPDRPIMTNVEYYTAAVLQGIGLPPDLFPATFAVARHAGLDGARPGAGRGGQAHPARRALHRPGRAAPAGDDRRLTWISPRGAPQGTCRRVHIATSRWSDAALPRMAPAH